MGHSYFQGMSEKLSEQNLMFSAPLKIIKNYVILFLLMHALKCRHTGMCFFNTNDYQLSLNTENDMFMLNNVVIHTCVIQINLFI